MLVHLHPTEQETRVQVEVHTAQGVQFEVTINPLNLIFRQPDKSRIIGGIRTDTNRRTVASCW